MKIMSLTFVVRFAFLLLNAKSYPDKKSKGPAMKIFSDTKKLVSLEKQYTTRILKNLMLIEKDKLYCDLKYPSLHKYIVKELGYSDAEATIRVNAVRLMLKSTRAEKAITSGELSLTNAAEANKAIGVMGKIRDSKQVDEIVTKASSESSRGFKKFVDTHIKKERREVVVLPEFILEQFDKMREHYGDIATFELIQILLEKELKTPVANVGVRRGRSPKVSNSRFIPKAVKQQVHTGKCANCGQKHSLEYDHKIKFSHGGDNSAENIQILCRNCNQRKEIIARQTDFFI